MKNKKQQITPTPTPIPSNMGNPARFSPSELQISPPDNEERFENLCLDLYRKELGEPIQKNGRGGQAQKGVDIFIQDQQIGIQCKKRQYEGKLTRKELVIEVEKAKKFTPSLERFILATTCKRDSKIQKEARLLSEEHKKQKLFPIEIHSWDEIKELFDKYPEVHRKYYGPPSNFPVPSAGQIHKFSNTTSINETDDQISHRGLVDSRVLVSAIKSDCHHSELNGIRDIIDTKPETALKQLERFKQEKWSTLDDNAKYRVLTNIGCAKIGMNQKTEFPELFIKALQFNEEDEDANSQCALAYFIKRDITNLVTG